MASADTISVDRATEQAQADASDPSASAWVSANAGSGKTHVLSQRVMRLLLAGTDPGRILCLTFTRAAAAQMATRVFDRLGRWATLPDRALAKELRALEGRAPGSGDLPRARRLFAQALETPGGLKIQTIHAFCERLLHQFPFEANVAGHFEVLDERDSDALAEQARRSVLAEAAHDPEAALGEALAAVLAAGSDMAHELAIAEFIRKRDRVRAWIVTAGSLDKALAELRERLELGKDDTPETLRVAVLEESAFSADDLARLIGLLREGSTADRNAAERLGPVLAATDTAGRAAAYLDFWTKTDGNLRVAASLVTNATRDRWPGLGEMLESEFARLTILLDRLAAAECYASTAAMLRLADAAIHQYDRLKTARGVLDFSDLIVKTANLLARADASKWVHYKLDRGIDHVLVDEAQDVSPRQWQVVKALVEEFFAGEGARAASRTLFAVGDQKQSIFSFQDAVPTWFTAMQRELRGRARDAGLGWSDPKLHLSFRSAQTVLSAVDAVFGREAVYLALSDEGVAPTHSAARRGAPGRVLIWPMIAPAQKQEPEDWTQPLDFLGDASPEVQLARRIARTIGGWLAHGERLDSGAPITPGGILILCRTRGAQTDAINRALKAQGVAIAGADRLVLTDHIAVMDLMALGRVMLLPEDDLSLAALLKSPLIGFDDDDLFALACGRRGTLWQSLADKAGADPRYADGLLKLEHWRGMADRIDPHAFYERILGAEGGRLAFMRRLGAEAEDVLDEFLAQTLTYEKANIPSLEGFLAWLQEGDTEIKRDTDTLRDEVRVMTVHGAKGLEADIVFLVDTGSIPVHSGHDPRLVSLDDDRDGTVSPLVWMRRLKAMPQVVDRRIRALREESRQEYLRLLYVAMTRARDRLYVCGTLKERATDLASGWHALVQRALEPGCVSRESDDGLVELEWRPESVGAARGKPRQPALPLGPHRPAWLAHNASPPPAALLRLTPSTALGGGATAAPVFAGRADPDTATALMRGRLIHRLLESLPDVAAANRQAVGDRYLAAFAPDWPEGERAALLAEVLAILDRPAFAPVFAEGSRAEVEIAGRLAIGGGHAIVSGRVDRLAVTADRVLIVDFKTNRPAPDRLEAVPPEYFAQLAVYRRILGRLYPDRAVSAAILWTDRPSLMEIPTEALDLADSAISGA
jgi:ATP-dependent helicase/nuclease subunit A